VTRTTFFTKSRFKLAAECPTKLFYTGKQQHYQDLKQEGCFLAMLADRGYQVGKLAKGFYLQAQTLEWLKQEKVGV
jgi:hypothetical protein